MSIRSQLATVRTIAKLFSKAARHGDGAAARDIEGALVSLIPEQMRQAQVEALQRVPELATMLTTRPLLPKGFGPGDVAHCRPGTLGEAYARLMREFELTQEFFPDLDTGDDLSYFRRRMMETHDIWHVLTDCPADLEGELGVIGFYFGHFARYMSGPTALYNVVVGMNLMAGLLYSLHSRPWRLPAIIARVRETVRQGYEAPPLFSVRWEDQWERPLAEVQRAYLG